MNVSARTWNCGNDKHGFYHTWNRFKLGKMIRAFWCRYLLQKRIEPLFAVTDLKEQIHGKRKAQWSETWLEKPQIGPWAGETLPFYSKTKRHHCKEKKNSGRRVCQEVMNEKTFKWRKERSFEGNLVEEMTNKKKKTGKLLNGRSDTIRQKDGTGITSRFWKFYAMLRKTYP